jgi:hypothetical protein
MVSIGAAAGGIDKAFHLGIACGYQYIQEAVDIGGVGGYGVGYIEGGVG